uniref:Transmembrane protein 222 n=1 Tax=Ornithorhynchus anatinus TaxID=9258 RepID=A0A6I8N969_ORNAN
MDWLIDSQPTARTQCPPPSTGPPAVPLWPKVPSKQWAGGHPEQQRLSRAGVGGVQHSGGLGRMTGGGGVSSSDPPPRSPPGPRAACGGGFAPRLRCPRRCPVPIGGEGVPRALGGGCWGGHRFLPGPYPLPTAPWWSWPSGRPLGGRRPQRLCPGPPAPTPPLSGAAPPARSDPTHRCSLVARRWFFPIIGHMGICTSTGIIRDFAGPYFVSEDNMAFGKPAKYWKLDPNKVYVSGPSAWDTAVHDASEEYKHHMHNLCCDNCHSHVALALNLMRYDNSARWNMVKLCLYCLLYGKYVSLGALVKTWLPFLLFLGVVLTVTLTLHLR